MYDLFRLKVFTARYPLFSWVTLTYKLKDVTWQFLRKKEEVYDVIGFSCPRKVTCLRHRRTSFWFDWLPVYWFVLSFRDHSRWWLLNCLSLQMEASKFDDVHSSLNPFVVLLFSSSSVRSGFVCVTVRYLILWRNKEKKLTKDEKER